VRYKLLSTDVPFRLSEAQAGMILTDGIIDREERNLWELIIVANDTSGATLSTATLKVRNIGLQSVPKCRRDCIISQIVRL